MARETYTSSWEQNILIRQIERLKEGVEVTVFNAEKAKADGIKREKETQIEDGKKQQEPKRHKHHAEVKKQQIKNK